MEVNNENLGIASKPTFFQKQPILAFVLVKSLPILIYFLPNLLIQGVSISFFIFLLFAAFEFKIIKDKLGIELVGLRWYFDPDSDKFIQFYNKPPPYVPAFFESNVFWVGFFVSISVWVISFIFALISSSLLKASTCLIGLIFQGTNLFLFIKGQSLAQKEAAEQARNTLLTDSVEFGLIKENEEHFHQTNETESTTEYEEEYEEESEEPLTSMHLPQPIV